MKYYKEKFGALLNHLYEKWQLPTSKQAMTMEDWEALDEANKTNYPVRYFLQETLPSKYRRVHHVCIKAPWDWVRFRTIERHHVIKLRDMEPHWADPDHLLLMANFQILCNFIEIDLARSNWDWWDERRPKGMPKWIWDRVRRNARSPQAGLDHIAKQEVIYAESGLPCPGTEQRELYMWWKEGYLARINAWDDERIWGEHDEDEALSATTRKKVNGHNCSTMASQLDDLYEEEEQAMLERLISVRKSLWY